MVSLASGTNKGKMEGHFSSKVNFQPDRSVPFTFRPKFRLHNSEMGLETRIFVNGTARFSRTRPTGRRGLPPEVVPNIPVGPNRNGPFHLTSARNFRKFWLNGKHPRFLERWSKIPKRNLPLAFPHDFASLQRLSR